jgi:hypothetical protein
MIEIISQFIVPITIVACVVGSVGIATLIIVLKDKIAAVHVSRSGLQMHTNDVPVWSGIVDEIKQFDAIAHTSIRRATERLMLIDPEKHGMSIDAMFIILLANQPLLAAAFENHHTREIASDGGDIYLANKTNDILALVKMWKTHFSELTKERIESFVCHWFKEIVSIIVRRTCLEKIAFYSKQIKRGDVSKTIKEILERCRDKNVGYIEDIDRLAERSDIAEKSTIFLQGCEPKGQKL